MPEETPEPLCIWSQQVVVGGEFPTDDEGKSRCSCGGSPEIVDEVIADHKPGKATS